MSRLIHSGLRPTSPKVIREVIRGEIGFDGLLMSDDLSMKALDGSLAARAKAAQFAGCDMVLHCNGDMDEMQRRGGGSQSVEGRSAQARQRSARRISVGAAGHSICRPAKRD